MPLYERLDTVEIKHRGHTWTLRRLNAIDGTRQPLISDELRALYRSRPDVPEHTTGEQCTALEAWSKRIMDFVTVHFEQLARCMASYLDQVDGKPIQATAGDLIEACSSSELLTAWGEWIALCDPSDAEKKAPSSPSTSPPILTDGTTASSAPSISGSGEGVREPSAPAGSNAPVTPGS
jgi:hypothetical protein